MLQVWAGVIVLFRMIRVVGYAFLVVGVLTGNTHLGAYIGPGLLIFGGYGGAELAQIEFNHERDRRAATLQTVDSEGQRASGPPSGGASGDLPRPTAAR